MWCYQKPGFEAFLLNELQKQQQCSDFCDTLLQAEGVSVPVHSSVLSAISPHMSSALSSTPMPPAGQSRLLDFRALGACTLLHIVRLLYSGEMTGEGEKEKQEAISAAAKLGIHGLVEVRKRDSKNRNWEGVGHYTEVGVQTESLPEGNEGRQAIWRREVRDGSTLLWKETQSNGGNDVWTQTEEQQINTAPSAAHSVASFETIDMETLQSLGQTDSCLVRPQIVPMSVVYPPNESQPFSAPSTSMQESTTAGSTSVAVVASPYTAVPPSLPYVSSQTALCAADPQTWLTGPQEAGRDAAATEEWEDERFEQFQGNIPGFINYFLNPVKGEGSGRGRAARRRGGKVGRCRSTGTGGSRARGPRAGRGGRGRGGITQKVDLQEVGVGRVQKLFLHRSGTRIPRTGQGGGAVGRKLYLNTREIFKPGTSCKRGRGRGKMWEFSQSRDVLVGGERGGGHSQRGRKKTAQQLKQDSGPVGRRGRAKSTTSASFSYPLLRFYNLHTLPPSIPVLQPSTSLLSPAASYMSPASSLLHTTPLPPPAPSTHDEQPENIDRLLEEVMMGLDILPNSRAPHSQVLLPGSSSSSNIFSSSGNTSAQNRQQCHATDVHRSTEVVAVARGAGNSSFKNGEAPVLQQQCEGELNEMLEHFLHSFEQQIESHGAREEETNVDSSADSNQPSTVLSKYKKTTNQTTTSRTSCLQKKNAQRRVRRPQTTGTETETLQSRSPPRQTSASRAVSPKHTEETLRKVKPPPKCPKKRKSKQYQLSLERKKVWVRKPVASGDATTQTVCDREDKQLKQRPVVHLERSSLLPVKVVLRRQSCLEDKSPEKAKTCSSSVKTSCESSSGTNQPTWISTKTYPIRSRFKEAQIVDSMLLLEEPLSADPPVRRRGRHRKNSQQLSLSNSNSSVPPAQTQPVDPGGTDKPLEKNQERREEESTVQPQEEADGPTSRGQKRAAMSSEDRSDDATVTKRVCFEQIPQPICETCMPNSESAISVSEPPTTEPEEIIDVETVSLSGLEGLHEEEEKPKPVWSEIKLRETENRLSEEEMYSSADEIIDVEGDDDNSEAQENKDKDNCQNATAASLSYFVDEKSSVSPSHQTKQFNPESTERWEDDKDEDIDVITGGSSVPEPVIISWTESSEGEEDEGGENIDVVEDRPHFINNVHYCE
ncbi:uncharacterized protein LOC111576483 isoform X2 [Amphiprion ocellaris]|nr:uncharacterized protein LOC111576483 isoform X2 [Amphiprion ocellaris]